MRLDAKNSPINEHEIFDLFSGFDDIEKIGVYNGASVVTVKLINGFTGTARQKAGDKCNVEMAVWIAYSKAYRKSYNKLEKHPIIVMFDKHEKAYREGKL